MNPSDDAAEQFKLVTRAYEVLSDQTKRSNYDATGDENGNGHPGFGAGGGQGFGGFGDIFEQFFGGGQAQGPASRTQPGRDALITITIDLEDAVHPDRKDQARQDVLAFAAQRVPGRCRLAVRLNALRSREGLADVHALVHSGVRFDAVVLPKTEQAREAVELAVQTLAEQALKQSATISDDADKSIAAIIAQIDHKLSEQINLILHHDGYTKEAIARQDKHGRNMAILERELAEHPEDPFVRFNLALKL